MIDAYNSIECQQDKYSINQCPLKNNMQLAKLNTNLNEKNNFYQTDCINDDDSVDCNDYYFKQSHEQKNNMKIEMLRLQCREKIEFSQRIKQIDSMQLDISYKIEMIKALKNQLQDKLQDQQSFRHLMRKIVSKKQKQNDSDSSMTKTTAAHSIASTVTQVNHMNPNAQNIMIIPATPVSNKPNQLSVTNYTQFANVISTFIQNNQDDNLSKRCSIFSVQTQVINSARKETGNVSPFNFKTENIQREKSDSFPKKNINPRINKKQILEQCQIEQDIIKKLENSLIPFKNERNKISEQLEDIKEELIVFKQYLRELETASDQKKIYNEQLMQKINTMSRSGYKMNNRENNTSNVSMLNQTRMNTTFIDETVSKFKAVKDFFKVKLFSSSNNSQSTNQQGQLFGQLSNRGNTQSNQYPMTNRILDLS